MASDKKIDKSNNLKSNISFKIAMIRGIMIHIVVFALILVLYRAFHVIDKPYKNRMIKFIERVSDFSDTVESVRKNVAHEGEICKIVNALPQRKKILTGYHIKYANDALSYGSIMYGLSNFKSNVLVDSIEIDNAHYEIIKCNIVIFGTAIYDTDFYKFIDYLRGALPGNVMPYFISVTLTPYNNINSWDNLYNGHSFINFNAKIWWTFLAKKRS